MSNRIYQWALARSASPHAPWWLALISFAESSFFPLPPDLLLIPMVLARPNRAFILGLICTVASVVGGLFGYWIGAEFFDRLAMPVLRFYHLEGNFSAFRDFYARWGFWAILVKGLTPIPFKLVTIASGAVHFSLPKFVLACVITRGGRFCLLEALPLYLYGDRARDFIEHRLGLILGAVAVVMVAVLIGLRYA